MVYSGVQPMHQLSRMSLLVPVFTAAAKGRVSRLTYPSSSSGASPSGKETKIIDLANRIASQGIKPDLTFILDIDPKIGLELARGKGVRDRMESQAMDFYERVREGYLEVARREPKRCKVIESVKDKLDVAKLQIMEEISKFIRIYDLDRILKK